MAGWNDDNKKTEQHELSDKQKQAIVDVLVIVLVFLVICNAILLLLRMLGIISIIR